MKSWSACKKNIQTKKITKNSLFLWDQNWSFLSLQGCNPVVKNTLKIWFQFRKHFHLSQTISLLPLANNHLFPPSPIDTVFQVWHKNGLVFFSDLFVEGTFASFNTLQKDHNLPNNHFFRYLQVCSFAKNHFPFPSLKPKNAADIILDLDTVMKRRVSKIYKTALGISPLSGTMPDWHGKRTWVLHCLTRHGNVV